MTEANAKRPVVLIIRDGWGWSSTGADGTESEGNATLLANTPVQDALDSKGPKAFLTCSGESVGLPEGQMGNSEVGHLNLGAGRIVYQDLTHISLLIREEKFEQTEALSEVMDRVVERGSRLHLMGLVSDGGVHSHIDHIPALVAMAKKRGVNEILLHCFMDGRDTSPTAGAGYLEALNAQLASLQAGRIATIIGRYFIMDRDNRWERVEQGYRLIVRGEGKEVTDPVQAMKDWYAAEKTDEFIPATRVGGDSGPLMRDGDGVICFNFRSDRVREITRALTFEDFQEFDRPSAPRLDYVCFTTYDETFDLPVAFPPRRMEDTLGAYVARQGKTQYRAAETEKYPHVTFFFNGGVETPNQGEERQMAPSPKVATYDLQPEMSAGELTDAVCERIRSAQDDMVILNFANPDMVGHTGIIPAVVKAVEVADACVGRVLEAVDAVGGSAIVTADHGNAELMRDPSGKPHTAHTTNLVQVFYHGPDRSEILLDDGILADVAPTILDIMGLEKPEAMTGRTLIRRS